MRFCYRFPQANTFKTNLANYDKPLVSWQTYHAKRGERMEKIAQKFGINVSQLRDVNDIPNGRKLNGAQSILVPNSATNPNSSPVDTDSSQPTTISDTSASSKENQTHTVTPKETLASIGREYHVSVKKLIAFNHLQKPTVKAGQVITIPSVANEKSTKKQKQNTESTVLSRDKKAQDAKKPSINKKNAKHKAGK
jgi:membrane-bound lytic murein transglycosylase D